MSLAEFASGIACVVATDAAKCERRSFTLCPPPPASANGSVRSLAAPAEPGVGVDTPRLIAELSPLMQHLLLLVAVGLTPYAGSFGAERLARGGTVAALVRRGLMSRTDGGQSVLTDSGRDAVCMLVKRAKPQ